MSVKALVQQLTEANTITAEKVLPPAARAAGAAEDLTRVDVWPEVTAVGDAIAALFAAIRERTGAIDYHATSEGARAAADLYNKALGEGYTPPRLAQHAVATADELGQATDMLADRVATAESQILGALAAEVGFIAAAAAPAAQAARDIVTTSQATIMNSQAYIEQASGL